MGNANPAESTDTVEVAGAVDSGGSVTAVADGLKRDEFTEVEVHSVVSEERSVGAGDTVEGGLVPWGLGSRTQGQLVGDGSVRKVYRSVDAQSMKW